MQACAAPLLLRLSRSPLRGRARERSKQPHLEAAQPRASAMMHSKTTTKRPFVEAATKTGGNPAGRGQTALTRFSLSDHSMQRPNTTPSGDAALLKTPISGEQRPSISSSKPIHYIRGVSSSRRLLQPVSSSPSLLQSLPPPSSSGSMFASSSDAGLGGERLSDCASTASATRSGPSARADDLSTSTARRRSHTGGVAAPHRPSHHAMWLAAAQQRSRRP